MSNQLRDLVLLEMKIPWANNHVQQPLDPSRNGSSFSPCQVESRRIHFAKAFIEECEEKKMCFGVTLTQEPPLIHYDFGQNFQLL